LNILESVRERFMRYVQYDTQAKSNIDTFPSTPSQLEFAKILEEECINIGLQEVRRDSNGYVYASLASNLKHEVPAIGFLAHMDTSPDFSGVNVKPKITSNYNGGDINLGNGTILSPSEFPCLKNYIGQDIISASGDTLLGADDKAGIAEILTAMEYLINHPEIPHGKICVGFTPDEEIGRGADRFDVEAFGATFAYTIDGGVIGELKSENFNAAQAEINITGKSVHPGVAKGIMINAALVAAELISKMPQNETPAETEGFEGFYHLMDLFGCVERARLFYSIRDFEKNSFSERKVYIQKIVAELNEKYSGALK
jgi:tripeptide aminopeptidase